MVKPKEPKNNELKMFKPIKVSEKNQVFIANLELILKEKKKNLEINLENNNQAQLEIDLKANQLAKQYNAFFIPPPIGLKSLKSQKEYNKLKELTLITIDNELDKIKDEKDEANFVKKLVQAQIDLYNKSGAKDIPTFIELEDLIKYNAFCTELNNVRKTYLRDENDASKPPLDANLTAMASAEFVAREFSKIDPLHKYNGRSFPGISSNGQPTQFKVLKAIEQGSSGFGFMILQDENEPNKLRIFSRNTRPTSALSWANNMGKCAGLDAYETYKHDIHKALRSAIDSIDGVDSLEFNGHSQGGGLSQILAAEFTKGRHEKLWDSVDNTQTYKKIKNVAVRAFNAPAVTEKIAKEFKKNAQSQKDCHFDLDYAFVNGDLVGTLGENLLGAYCTSTNIDRTARQFEIPLIVTEEIKHSERTVKMNDKTNEIIYRNHTVRMKYKDLSPLGTHCEGILNKDDFKITKERLDNTKSKDISDFTFYCYVHALAGERYFKEELQLMKNNVDANQMTSDEQKQIMAIEQQMLAFSQEIERMTKDNNIPKQDAAEYQNAKTYVNQLQKKDIVPMMESAAAKTHQLFEKCAKKQYEVDKYFTSQGWNKLAKSCKKVLNPILNTYKKLLKSFLTNVNKAGDKNQPFATRVGSGFKAALSSLGRLGLFPIVAGGAAIAFSISFVHRKIKKLFTNSNKPAEVQAEKLGEPLLSQFEAGVSAHNERNKKVQTPDVSVPKPKSGPDNS